MTGQETTTKIGSLEVRGLVKDVSDQMFTMEHDKFRHGDRLSVYLSPQSDGTTDVVLRVVRMTADKCLIAWKGSVIGMDVVRTPEGEPFTALCKLDNDAPVPGQEKTMQSEPMFRSLWDTGCRPSGWSDKLEVLWAKNKEAINKKEADRVERVQNKHKAEREAARKQNTKRLKTDPPLSDIDSYHRYGQLDEFVANYRPANLSLDRLMKDWTFLVEEFDKPPRQRLWRTLPDEAMDKLGQAIRKEFYARNGRFVLSDMSKKERAFYEYLGPQRAEDVGSREKSITENS